MSKVYWVLTGPTAAGKTAALIQQAATRPMVAISADSRQVYRHMNIGTGTPTTDETILLSHKVINVVAPLDRFNAHTFLIYAARALREARSDNLEPWVVGGTGLYIRALVDNLGLGSHPRPKLRTAIGRLLEQKAPVDVAKHFGVGTADDSNPVRVARAIENACNEISNPMSIYRLAGLNDADYEADRPVERSQDGLKTREELSTWRCGGLVVIDPGKEELLANIRLRVERMFLRGLAREVTRLRELGFGQARVVAEGIGYREAGEMLDGRINQFQAIESTVVRTRQYAKRQRTYFKNRGWETIHPSEFKGWFELRKTGDGR